MEKVLNLDDIVASADAEEVVKEVLSGGDFDATREVGKIFPYSRKVSINDIVPIDMQNQLMQIDLTLSTCYWQIGDAADELINSVNRQKTKELGKLISQTDIFEAIGYFCHRSARSVRYYWTTASYFPVEIRMKYLVPFNVYAVARWCENWELVLKLSDENPQWSAERVRSEYYKIMEQDAPVRHREEKPVEIGSADIEEPDEDMPSRYKAVLLSKLDHTVDSLRAVLDKIPLPTTTRVRIGNVLLEISDIELEIRREV